MILVLLMGSLCLGFEYKRGIDPAHHFFILSSLSCVYLSCIPSSVCFVVSPSLLSKFSMFVTFFVSLSSSTIGHDTYSCPVFLSSSDIMNLVSFFLTVMTSFCVILVAFKIYIFVSVLICVLPDSSEDLAYGSCCVFDFFDV